MEWKRACKFGELKEENHNNRNNRNNRNNQNNIEHNERGNRFNNNNNERGYRYSRREDEFERKRRESELKREEEKKKELNEINFPDLVEKKEKKELTNIGYLDKIKLKHEEEENSGKIMLRDKKNWRGNVWIGPKFVKANKFSEEHEQQIKNYLNIASKNATTIILPLRKTYYSRNNVDWYESWEKTFTEDELMKMNIQLEREVQEDLNKRMNECLEILYQKRKAESDRHYEETGELDDFAIAEIEHDKYEKWLEEFEKQFEDEENDEEDYEDDEMETDN